MTGKPEDEKKLFKRLIPGDAKFGIEIGVLNGETSGFFLSEFPLLRLTGIDPFIPDSMEPALIGKVGEVLYNTQNYPNRFSLISDYSYNVADEMHDEYYDFVFIDGSHFYDDVKLDYELYYPKIRKAGFIFFHDSRMNRGGAPFHEGPSKFVDELIEVDRTIILNGEAFSLTAFRKL